MRYISFEIQNYKGIRKLRLGVERPDKSNILTLIGLNESGKTTILEAINTFQVNPSPGKAGELIPKFSLGNFTDAISITATLRIQEPDLIAIRQHLRTFGYLFQSGNELTIEKRFVFDASKYKRKRILWPDLKIKKGKQPLFSKARRRKEVLDSLKQFILTKLLPPIIYYPNFLFQFPEHIYLEGKGSETAEQELYRQSIQDILDSHKKDYDLEQHVLNRIKSSRPNDRMSLDQVLTELGSSVTQTVSDTWTELFRSPDRNIVVQNLRDGNRISLQFGLNQGSQRYRISDKSLGFKWIFSFLLFTEFRNSRKSDRGEKLFLLDEPASNLHSTAQNKLLKRFDKLLSGSKLIYTTHSHHLIDRRWIGSAYIVRNLGLDLAKEYEFDSSKSTIEVTPYTRFVASHPKQTDYYQPVLDALDYKPSDLELTAPIVIVEGKNDFYTLKWLNESILHNRAESLGLYPGGGARVGNNAMVIGLYIAWSREFLVIVDDDLAGQKAKRKYESRFGVMVKDRIRTLSDLAPDLKGHVLEDLFETDEKRAIVQEFDGTGHQFGKQKFNLAIQHLLFLQKSVELSETTRRKAEAVLKPLLAWHHKAAGS